jgi:hypothetical protein
VDQNQEDKYRPLKIIGRPALAKASPLYTGNTEELIPDSSHGCQSVISSTHPWRTERRILNTTMLKAKGTNKARRNRTTAGETLSLRLNKNPAEFAQGNQLGHHL